MSLSPAARARRYRDRKRGAPPRHEPLDGAGALALRHGRLLDGIDEMRRETTRAWARLGRYLKEIRDLRLYRHAGHATFDAYLVSVGLGRTRARHAIALHKAEGEQEERRG